MVAQFSTGILAHFSISIYKFKSVREKSWEKVELRKAEKTMSVIIENKDDIAKIMAQILFDNENKKGG